MPFNRFLIRCIISAVIISCATILPFLILLTRVSFSQSDAVGLIILVAVINVLLNTLTIFMHYRLMVIPLKQIVLEADKVIDGHFSHGVDIKAFDKSVLEVSTALTKLSTEFENLEQMRKSFVTNASHELRSPLTSMQGFLQAMLDDTITSEQDRKQYLEIVFNETKRLSYMINSMLELSRMESGKYPLYLSKFELNETIRRIVIRFEPNLIKKSLQLTVDFAKEAFVFADRERIEQVIINIIDNAIKYSPENSQIIVSTRLHHKKVYVSVKDKGFGIDKKDQAMIWDRFYMADKARTPSREKGTGLGLSIVKRIIDEHKEIIWVESAKGQGSTFIFSLSIFDPSRHKVQNKPQ